MALASPDAFASFNDDLLRVLLAVNVEESIRESLGVVDRPPAKTIQASMLRLSSVCKRFSDVLLEAPTLFWEFNGDRDERYFHEYILGRTRIENRLRAVKEIVLVVGSDANLRAVLLSVLPQARHSLQKVRLEFSPRTDVSGEGETLRLLFGLLASCCHIKQLIVNNHGPYIEMTTSILHNVRLVTLTHLVLDGCFLAPAVFLDMLRALPVLTVLTARKVGYRERLDYNVHSKTLRDLIWSEEVDSFSDDEETESKDERTPKRIQISCPSLVNLELLNQSNGTWGLAYSLKCPELQSLTVSNRVAYDITLSSETPLLHLNYLNVRGLEWNITESLLRDSHRVEEFQFKSVPKEDLPTMDAFVACCEQAGVQRLLLYSDTKWEPSEAVGDTRATSIKAIDWVFNSGYPSACEVLLRFLRSATPEKLILVLQKLGLSEIEEASKSAAIRAAQDMGVHVRQRYFDMWILPSLEQYF